MRLLIRFNARGMLIPFTYQNELVKAFHFWLGYDNKLHENIKLCSLSWLRGSVANNSGLYFQQFAYLSISSHHKGLIDRLLIGISEHPKAMLAMEVKEIKIIETPKFSEREYFLLDSPILIKRSMPKHLLQPGKEIDLYAFWDDPRASRFLEQTIKKKMQAAGVDYKVSIRFDTNYKNPKKKTLKYKGIVNRASLCPVIIEGDPKGIAFCWNVGVGNSTGIGFGALR